MVLWYGAGPSCSLQSLQVRTCLPGEGGVGKVPKQSRAGGTGGAGDTSAPPDFGRYK